MNYAKTITAKVKECSKCQITKTLREFETGRNVCFVCRGRTGTGKNLGVLHRRKEEIVVKREYEPRELSDIKEFRDYADLLVSVFRPGEWLTIAEIHRRIGESSVIRRWTYDAIRRKPIEMDETKLLDRFRLV